MIDLNARDLGRDVKVRVAAQASRHGSAGQMPALSFWPLHVHAFQAMQQGSEPPHSLPGCSTEANAMCSCSTL